MFLTSSDLPSAGQFFSLCWFGKQLYRGSSSWKGRSSTADELLRPHYQWDFFLVCSLYMCVCLFLKVPMTLFPTVVRKDTEAQTPSGMHVNHFNSQLRRDVTVTAGESKGPCWSVRRPLRVLVVAYNVGLRAQKCSANVYLGAVIHYYYFCELWRQFLHADWFE